MRFSTGKLFMLGVLGAVMALFPADGLRAMGLGEARVDSYLGQTLDVTIRLVEADSAALDSLTVAPATARDYERLGVPSGALALGLDVTVDRRVDPPVLRVRSRRTVSEPVIQFMVDARWSGGRLLREYTLFLDPPTLDVAPPVVRTEPERPPVSEPAPPVTPSEPAPPAEVRPRAPAAAPSEPAAREEPPEQPRTEPQPPRETRPAAGPEVVGPVGSGETLWSIAYGWRPDTSLTMNQVMLAIFERNPQAFMDGNVNRLRQGAELTMPSGDQVRSISAGEADRRIREQMQAWQQASGTRQVPVVAEAAVPEVEADVSAPSPEPTPSETPDVAHRLEVVPPESEVFDDGAAVSDGEISRASGRLSELEDQMWAEELEREDLIRQIESIRDAIETREAAGLAVADEEIAILEDRLREAREARAVSETAAAGPESDEVDAYFRELEDELGLGAEDDTIAADSDLAEADDVGADVEPVAEAEPAPAPVARTGSDGGLMAWMWPALGLLVILGLVALVLVMRRSAGSGRASGSKRFAADEAAARARIAARPGSLAAHLALLEALGAQDDTDGFSNALDDMYQQVESDDDPDWQAALNMAVVHAPNHPLLTPNETALADDVDDSDGLDDRTREMLGILGADESEQAPNADEIEPASPDDYEIDSDLQPEDEKHLFEADDVDEFSAPTEPELDQQDDFDLAEISDRLDADAERPARSDDEVDEAGAVAGEDDEDTEDDLELDFSFSSSERAVDADSAGDGSAAESDHEPPHDSEAASSEVDEPMAESGEAEFESDVDPDREIEDFLRPDSDQVGNQPESEEGEPALSNEDAEVKLDLARAYLSMDDPDSARTLLEEVTSGGSAAMRDQAQKLLDGI